MSKLFLKAVFALLAIAVALPTWAQSRDADRPVRPVEGGRRDEPRRDEPRRDDGRGGGGVVARPDDRRGEQPRRPDDRRDDRRGDGRRPDHPIDNDHRGDDRNWRRPDRPVEPGRREEDRRGDSERRHGDWGRGRVVRHGDYYHYRPSRPIEYRPNHFRCEPYRGRWEDYIRPVYGSRYARYSTQFIGSTYLDQDGDYDVIDVNDYTNCVKAVRIRVEQQDAFIDRIEVHFADGRFGETDFIDVNGYFPAGSGDREWRDLAGWGSRCIDSLVVVGQTQFPRDEYGRVIYPRDRWGRPVYDGLRQAQVEVWGLR